MTTLAGDALLDVLRAAVGGGEVAGLERRPYPYATSAPLEELRLRLASGEQLSFIAKDLDPQHLLGEAPEAKRVLMPEPRRELLTYVAILAPAGIGPRLAAASDPEADEHWLVLEKVPGVELWQVREPAVWQAVAEWLARFHVRFAHDVAALRERNPYLIDHDERWFALWRERALAALARSDDERAPDLRAALTRADALAAELAAMPRTLVHGELYPSNVLVGPGSEPLEVWPVDWETAGIGPGLIDLAALTSGWDRASERALVQAYERARGEPVAESALTRCRLQLALQLLGRGSSWSPPAEHTYDWLGEALDLCKRLDLA